MSPHAAKKWYEEAVNLTDDYVQYMMDVLDDMYPDTHAPADGLGKYLGDGRLQKVDLRTVPLLRALQELLQLRREVNEFYNPLKETERKDMEAIEFCKWLKEVLDFVGPSCSMTPSQVQRIGAKLNEVFDHVVEPVQAEKSLVMPAVPLVKSTVTKEGIDKSKFEVLC